MRILLLPILLIIVTPVSLPMDPLKKATTEYPDDLLLFKRNYVISEGMSCIAFINRDEIFTGSYKQSFITNCIDGTSRTIPLSAKNIVSYPNQNCMVITNNEDIRIYRIDRQELHLECMKENKYPETVPYVGKSFLICDGKYLVTSCGNEIILLRTNLKRKNVLGLSKKPSQMKEKNTFSAPRPLYTGPSSLSDDWFVCEHYGHRLSNVICDKVRIGKKGNVSFHESYPVSCINMSLKIVVTSSGSCIAYLSYGCFVCEENKKEYNVELSDDSIYIAMAFYTDSILAVLSLDSGNVVYQYRAYNQNNPCTFRMEYYDFKKKEVIFSHTIKKIVHDVYTLKKNPSDIVFLPDGTRSAVLLDNAAFVFSIPMHVALNNSRFKNMMVNYYFLIRCLGWQLPSELSRLISYFWWCLH